MQNKNKEQIRCKFDKEYIRYAQATKNLPEIVEGFWYDLCGEVDYQLDENSNLSVQEACEIAIDDTFFGPFHMHMFMHAFVEDAFTGYVEHQNDSPPRLWPYFLEEFEEFMGQRAPKILLKVWQKKNEQR